MARITTDTERPAEKVILGTWVSRDLADAVKAEAAREGRSTSSWLRRVLNLHVDPHRGGAS